MIQTPPYLETGDTIGLLCPAGYMSLEKVRPCVQLLEQWGYRVRVGRTVGSPSADYFSGTDAERLQEFQEFLDDPTIKAILCARGGYGTSRLIDQVRFKTFRRQPKWIIGFSDVTVLHCHLYAQLDIASLHAPMASAFAEAGPDSYYLLSLKDALEGRKAIYECPPHELNRKGTAVGELVGGNLSLLAHLSGTVSEPKTKGRILFIEDVGEYLYNIDRMMLQLKRNGKLDKLAGLIVGGFTDTKDTERPFGQTAYEIIHRMVNDYDYPVCFGFPVSHEPENVALKVGVGYKLVVGKVRVHLEE